jgi:hypothetical protein
MGEYDLDELDDGLTAEQAEEMYEREAAHEAEEPF